MLPNTPNMFGAATCKGSPGDSEITHLPRKAYTPADSGTSVDSSGSNVFDLWLP